MPGYLLQVIPPMSYPQRPITSDDILGGSLMLAVLFIGLIAWGSWREKHAARQNRRAQERVLPFSPKIRAGDGGVSVSDTSHGMLVAASVSYRTSNDERAFLDWLYRIEGVDRVQSAGGDVRVHVRRDIDEPALRDLVALFFRYGVDLTQIPKVFSVDAHAWLLDRSGYWFGAMFPDRLAS